MKKGVSLLALVATIMVIGILASTVVLTGADALNNTKKMQFADELNSIQGILEEARITDALDDVLVKKHEIDEMFDPNLAAATSLEPKNANNAVELYQVDLEKLGVEKITRGNGKKGVQDIYVYSKNTGRVYYVLGNKISKTKYYSLTQDLDVKNQFSLLEYFPLAAKGQSVSITDGVSMYTTVPEYISGNQGEFYAFFEVPQSILDFEIQEEPYMLIQGRISTKTRTIYAILCTKDAAKYGTTLTINTVNGQKKYDDFKVAILDEQAPTIDESKISMIYYKGAAGTDVRLYISDGAVVDSGTIKSPIKEIRYFFGEYPGSLEELKKVSALVTGESVPMVDPTILPKVCIYAEDQMGNASYKSIDIPHNIMSMIKSQ